MKLKKISVALGTASYDILIGSQMLASLGRELRQRSLSKQVAVVTHPLVDRLYGRVVRKSLKEAHFETVMIPLPSGEKYKTLRQIERIYDALISHRFERGSLLMALGGGVVGDMTGFAAATFLRGVSYIHVPTTLVAQVDASIGGKTGVDHSKGKNLIGSFHQPRMVFIDPATLSTLPRREFVAGIAEVVKYGVILGPAFFKYLESHVLSILALDADVLSSCIGRSASMKARVVAADEKESGLRRILNYGHTIGHAIETLTSYKRYKHGEAVSIGMSAAARLSNFLGLLPKEEVLRQENLLKRFGLPTKLPKLAPERILDRILQDKKVNAGEVFFVLPEKIGAVRVDRVSKKDIKAFLKSDMRC